MADSSGKANAPLLFFALELQIIEEVAENISTWEKCDEIAKGSAVLKH